jgi:ASC-1-like (ASCH) protein
LKKTTATSKFRAAVSILLFFALAAGLLFYLNCVFDLKDDKSSEKVFEAFYNQKENSLDGIYLGSSAVYRYFVPTQAFEDKGMAIFDLGTGSQPIVLDKYIIREALKTQPDMKVIVIDIRSLTSSDELLKEADIRRVTDAMKQSKNRIDAINAGLEYFRERNADISYNKMYYYFPFLLYHNRWNEDIGLEDLKGTTEGNLYKGFIATNHSMTSVAVEQPTYTTEKTEPEASNKAVLQDLLDYCSTLDQKVIFVSSPFAISEDRQKLLNSYTEMIRDAGFTMYNFNTEEGAAEIGLDWDTDFLDSGHVNYYGAVKFTRWMEKAIAKEVQLEDHRNDLDYESWVQAAGNLAKELKIVEVTDSWPAYTDDSSDDGE